MAGIITPLSRRPRWLLIPVPLFGLLLPALLLSTVHLPSLFPITEWLPILFLPAFAGFLYRGYSSLAVTDYDADYLYVFSKTGTQQIPLGNFYKLIELRGWQLYYLDEQQQKQTLEIIALSIGWLWNRDNSSIHGFIDAVWQHNLYLDVRHDWLR